MEKNIFSKIKSINNLKDILSFISRNIKLDLIKYNKNSQNKLQISIEDYKNSSKAYKIGEQNGKGKEYDIITDDLIFEGEYKNGKKNGKGIEYYNNKYFKKC